MSEISSPPEFLHIQATCRAHGLEITAASRQGVMLTLTPRSLDDLPEAQILREIADALGGDGIRYVTLAIDDAEDNADG